MSIFNNVPEERTAALANADEREKLETRMKNGAHWFFWVAGMSLINSLVLMAGGTWNFVLGLAITQVVDVIVLAIGGAQVGELNGTVLLSLMMNILIAAFFVMIGYLAGRGSIAMFVIGIFIYVLDGALYLYLGDYFAAGFHVFALFYIGRGLLSALEFKKERNGPMLMRG